MRGMSRRQWMQELGVWWGTWGLSGGWAYNEGCPRQIQIISSLEKQEPELLTSAGAKLSSSDSISSYNFQNPPPPPIQSTLLAIIHEGITNYFHHNWTSSGRGLVMRVIKYLELAPVLSLWFVLVSNCVVCCAHALYWPDRRTLPDVIVMCRGKKQMSAAATVRTTRHSVCIPAIDSFPRSVI